MPPAGTLHALYLPCPTSSVDLSTPEFSALGLVFLDLVFLRELHGDGPPIQMFTIASLPITQFRTANSAHNYIFPSASARLPNTPLGQGYILTSNWTEKAIVKARFYTDNTSTLTCNITDMGITLNMHFECDQFFQAVVPKAAPTVSDSDNLAIILGTTIPLGLLIIVSLLVLLRKFRPEWFGRQTSRHENVDLSQQMLPVEHKEKKGTSTWTNGVCNDHEVVAPHRSSEAHIDL